MKVFKRLVDAYEKCGENEFTYAVNYKNNLASFFVNATELDFWNEYMLKGPKNNYEIIRVDRPCHLYLDLDKDNTLYPDLDIEDVWKEIEEKLYASFEYVGVALEDLNFIKLSSHSTKKQSLHIIVKIKNKIFKNMLECGYFMERVKDQLTPYYAKILDTTVYTKNRCFRMLGCTKAGQERYLIGDKPLTFDYWKKCKIQPLKWDGEKGSILSFEDNVTYSVSTSKYIPEIIYKKLNELNQNKHFLSMSGPLNLDRVFAIPNALKFICDTTSKKCPIAKKTHSTNITYIVLDLVHSNYFFKCRSHKHCKGKRTKSFKINNLLTKTISF